MWVASLALASLSGCGSAAQPRQPDGCVIEDEYEALAKQVLSLVNIERAMIGVAPLAVSDELTLAAEDYACIMAAEDFFNHIDPLTGEGPGDRAAATGYVYFEVGENLAAGQRTAAEVVEDWMNSPEHRDALCSPKWKETGIGVRGGGTYDVYWVQEFGRPVVPSR